MALTDSRLDDIVTSWKDYAERSPSRIDARDVLVKRDLKMYQGLGLANAPELAARLVADRSVATLEMTMGHLYERVLQGLGSRKVTLNEKKRTEGLLGIDFVQTVAGELRLINLKSSLSTGNGDINEATVRHLAEAAEFWENHRAADDNPLREPIQDVVKVRAVARGPSRNQTTNEGIVWLVGDAMWSYLGAGEALLVRLSEALGRNPLDYARYNLEQAQASDRIIGLLTDSGFVRDDGSICWPELVSAFP